MKWQTIETAPRDADLIVSGIRSDGERYVWFGKHHRYAGWEIDGDFPPPANHPTHWMPLPPPPEAP